MGEEAGGRPQPTLVGGYHPSRQNTNTGTLTARMMEGVFTKTKRLALTEPPIDR